MSTSRQTGGAGAFRPDIQALRAMAMGAVALFHANFPGLAGGYVGVDIFFVISGYLITGLLVREVGERGGIDFAAFYSRRIRRLLPAALLVFVATSLAAYVLLSPLEQREIIRPLMTSALYVSNLWFATQATDYLAGDLHVNPLLHTWSLSVEEQFYLAWPLLVLLGARAGGAHGMRVRMVAVMTAVFVASLAASLWLTATAQPWAFFASPARAWEFAAGGLVCMGSGRLASLKDRTRDILAASGFAMMAASILLFDGATRFPGVAAMLPVAGAALFIAAGAGSAGRLSRLCDKPVLQWLGNVSYSWYLWHWPVLVFPAVLWRPLDLPARMFWVAVSLGLAALTYHAVENRVRFSATIALVPFRGLALGALLTVAAVASAASLRGAATQALSSPVQAAFNAARDDLPAIYHDGCHLPFEGVSAPACVYGDRGANRTMVLFGDSHAAQWFPALERIARETGWRLVSLTKSACPGISVALRNTALGRPYEECASWREYVLGRIASSRPTLVVLANSDYYRRDPGQHIDAAAWGAGLEKTLTEIQRTGSAVIVLHDTPRPGFDVPVCLSRAAWRHKGEVCDFSRERTDAPVPGGELPAIRAIERVRFIDLSDLLCDASRCPAVIGGTVAYRDSNHLTAAVSRMLAPALHARMAVMFPGLKTWPYTTRSGSCNASDNCRSASGAVSGAARTKGNLV